MFDDITYDWIYSLSFLCQGRVRIEVMQNVYFSFHEKIILVSIKDHMNVSQFVFLLSTKRLLGRPHGIQNFAS